MKPNTLFSVSIALVTVLTLIALTLSDPLDIFESYIIAGMILVIAGLAMSMAMDHDAAVRKLEEQITFMARNSAADKTLISRHESNIGEYQRGYNTMVTEYAKLQQEKARVQEDIDTLLNAIDLIPEQPQTNAYLHIMRAMRKAGEDRELLLSTMREQVLTLHNKINNMQNIHVTHLN